MNSPFDQSDGPASQEHLPDQLPVDPMPLCRRWFDEACSKKVQPNPNAFTLATLDPPPRSRIAARIVLCKEMDPGGSIVFYTNYTGRKAIALDANPHAAALFHWDTLDRQIRIEGPVTKTTPAESDAYFATRPRESQIGAWASQQSRPIESREAMRGRVADAMARFGAGSPSIPRPPHWGGYRIWAERIELWVAGDARIHDRAAWSRTLTAAGTGFASGPWTATRLQP